MSPTAPRDLVPIFGISIQALAFTPSDTSLTGSRMNNIIINYLIGTVCFTRCPKPREPFWLLCLEYTTCYRLAATL